MIAERRKIRFHFREAAAHVRTEHDHVMRLLADAMDLPASGRRAFLDSTCAGDSALRRELEELLDCADPAAEAFDDAADRLVRADPQQVGPYEILAPVGEGGMAIVYKARQHHPVQRVVALKLIKLGMDTRQFVARFEAERQALAVMDHPNIARVYDAGATDAGRPYFVMEFVEGRPILGYCDERGLDVRRRLELLATVCDAVEHAHRRGIIHRDLKDTNVLVAGVDGKPVPKVIDFGVAKAIQQPLTDAPLQTEATQLLGTPEYMSPEQAEHGGLDVDTRADVYSLGVLLYELIAGVSDDGSVARVSFYREGNGVAGLQVGFQGDTLVGIATQPIFGAWLVDAATAGLPAGTYTYWAQATDNTELVGAPASTSITITPAAPAVTNSGFNFATLPQRLSFTFNQNVGPILGLDDIVVQQLPGGPTVAPSGLSYDAQTNTATFSFSSALPDGRYRARLIASGISGPGGQLPADHLFEFTFLRGDANGDGRVNLNDFNVLAANFGQSPRDFTQGDFDYSGNVNLSDFNILASRFGVVVAPSAGVTARGHAGDDELPADLDQLLE